MFFIWNHLFKFIKLEIIEKYIFFIKNTIQFKIICIAIFTIQLLQSNFTGSEVSKIDLYCRNSI